MSSASFCHCFTSDIVNTYFAYLAVIYTSKMEEQQACEKVCIKLADPFTEALQQVMARIVLAGPIAMNSTDVPNRAEYPQKTIRKLGDGFTSTSDLHVGAVIDANHD
ncbi:hypothetical protein AVEN_260589-1 [Araneus ventricosus]|uniref:Uncharacterized protein n=1 Tax=Araneus ventricosus TaxID=182803 RepID=A0A4Y2QXA5_ARAVE|nr:hypothetical protein AVEN_260589-1 [Araneus ventricosus]